VSFDRQKRLLLGQLALLVPLPLPFNDVVGWPALLLFWISVAIFMFRVQRGETRPLPNWAMNLLGIAYLPFLIVDFSIFWHGRLLRPLAHLALFTLVVKLFGMRRERDKWHAFLLIFFVFLSSMASSVHPTMLLYLMAFLVLTLQLLGRFASFHVLSSYGLGQPNRTKVPLKGFLVAGALGTALLAVPLFTMLPRLGRPYVVGPGLGSGRLTSGAAFLDQITLDSIGRVRTSRAVVMRLTYDQEPPVSDEIRLKGGTFRRFTGKAWQRGRPDSIQLQRGGEGHFRLAPGNIDRWMQIWLHLAAGDSLVMPVEARAVEFQTIGLAMDDSGVVSPLIYPPGTVNYRVGLAEGRPQSLPYPAPRLNAGAGDELSGVTERIGELAAEVAGSGSVAEQAERIETYLIQNYDYTLDLLGFDSGSPVEDFLFSTRRGHCEYFASSMVLMLRSLGIPSRLATGYLGAEYNPFEGYYIVRQSNSHAWVEAYLADEGWRVFDPTPPDGRPLVESSGARLLFEQAWDFVIFRWDRYVLTFGFADQVSIFSRFHSLWETVWEKLRSRQERQQPEDRESVPVESDQDEGSESGSRLVPSGYEWIGFLIFALVAVWWLWSHWPDLNGARAYRKLRERVANKKESELADSMPPLEFAELVAKRVPTASRSTHRVVELYLRESFGGEELSQEERGELKEVLTDAVRALRKTA
jgi:transglutaminase-like putative cysteine protease